MHDDLYPFDDDLTDDERAALAQQADEEDEYIRIQEERAYRAQLWAESDEAERVYQQHLDAASEACTDPADWDDDPDTNPC